MSGESIFILASIVILMMSAAFSVWAMREARTTLVQATMCLRALIEIVDAANAPAGVVPGEG